MVSYLSMKKLKCADYTESTPEVKVETLQYRETIKSYCTWTSSSLTLRDYRAFLNNHLGSTVYTIRDRIRNKKYIKGYNGTLRDICAIKVSDIKLYLKIRKPPTRHKKYIFDYRKSIYDSEVINYGS